MTSANRASVKKRRVARIALSKFTQADPMDKRDCFIIIGEREIERTRDL